MILLNTSNTRVPILISKPDKLTWRVIRIKKGRKKKGQIGLDEGISHIYPMETEVCLHLIKDLVRLFFFLLFFQP